MCCPVGCLLLPTGDTFWRCGALTWWLTAFELLAPAVKLEAFFCRGGAVVYCSGVCVWWVSWDSFRTLVWLCCGSLWCWCRGHPA